ADASHRHRPDRRGQEALPAGCRAPGGRARRPDAGLPHRRHDVHRGTRRPARAHPGPADQPAQQPAACGVQGRDRAHDAPRGSPQHRGEHARDLPVAPRPVQR
ncbi:MAG: hypothetical protein ACK56F_14050, partial [bacterium]